MAVRSLIKRLLVYEKRRRQENELLDREEQEWQVGTSTSQDESKDESCREELEMAIQMVECIYDLDGPDDLPESPELVEFLCAEPDKPPLEVHDHLEVIELGTKEDLRPIQINGLLESEDQAKIIYLLQEFRDCFAWHYTEMPDAVAKHKVLSFMDGNAGYNQIKMASEDIHKTAFRCPGHVGAYEYLVMPFGLKNAGATYQRAMNAIFHDLIGHNMEVYIDDIVVKSKTKEQHLIDLKLALTRMRIHKLKMNPKKCAFGVRAGNFLGFLVHQRDVEVDKNKARAILESPSPTNKVQLQRLLGKINFLRRFIANLAGKIQPLTPLLKMKDKENFEWGPPHQEAFDSIKAYLTSPPVLVPPQRGKPLKLYISASDKSIGSLLAQNNEGWKEQAVYFLSRILIEVETRIGKWILALSEFSFQYVPQRAVKGQAIADFLAEHQESQDEIINIPGTLLDVMILETEIEDWRLPIIHHLKDPSSPTSKKDRHQATKYVLWAEDLLRKTPDRLLLKCLGQEESMRVMAEVHEGVCGAHQVGTKMRWLLMSPEKWHEKLGNTLWAYRTSKRAGTWTTLYALTFGQDAVLPMEINVSSVRIQNQFGLHSEKYIEAMCQGIEDLDVARIEALNQIQEGKKAVARAYNKKVKAKSFKEGDLVWKTVLPLGAQPRGFGK
ncbi:unnamed protein product [Malus baccata var. baccata]